MTGCLDRTGERPGAYLERLGLLSPRTGARARRVDGRTRARARRRTRRDRGDQPGVEPQARGRPHLPVREGARARHPGRARHRRRVVEQLARPARRREGARAPPEVRGRRPRRAAGGRGVGGGHRRARTRCSAARRRLAVGATRPTSSSPARPRPSSRPATSSTTSCTPRRARSSAPPSCDGRVLMRDGVVGTARRRARRCARTWWSAPAAWAYSEPTLQGENDMTTTDPRPAVWTGHLVIAGKDLAASTKFYEAIGMREVAIMDEVAIFELRGGTHLVVRKDPDAKPGPGPLGPHGRGHPRDPRRLERQGPHGLADREGQHPRRRSP